MKADGALLFLLEGEQFAIEATTGVPEGLRAMGGLSRTESRIGRILQSGQPSAVENMEADPEWRLEFLARRFGYRGMMAVPVIAQGEPLGVLKLVFYQPHPVIPGALRLLQAFGDQAALVIKNAGLYADARRRRREADTLAHMAGEISASLNPEEVFPRIAEAARTLAESDTAILALNDGEGERGAWVLGVVGEQTEGLRRISVEAGRGVGGTVLATGRPFVTENYQGDSRISHGGDDWNREERIVALAAVPVFLDGGRRGFLQVAYRSPRRISFDLVEMLERLAHHAALAIGNARLHRTIKEHMTELRAAQAQLLHSGRLAALGQWAASLAHTLKGPLAAIMGYAELALRRIPPTDPNRHQLETIREETSRLDRTIDRQLMFARAETDPPEPLNLNRSISEALHLFSAVLGRGAVRVVTDLKEPLPPVLADRGQIQELLVNLILNAVDAMPAGGELRVWTACGPDETVEVGISDAGCGIPAHRLETVWGPFFTTKPPGKETGLGLSLSRAIVVRHGGTVELQSAEGAGTTVKIRFPAMTSAE